MMSIRYRYLMAGVMSAASVAAVTACSSSDNNGGGGGDNGPPPAKSGYVLLTNARLSEGNLDVQSYSATAAFTDATGVTVPNAMANCTITQEGGCSVHVCSASGADAGPEGDAGTAKVVGAGNINITGGKEPVALAANSDGTYPEVSSQTSLLWSGGEAITIAAAGDNTGVGTFTAALQAPSFISLSAPAFDHGHATIDRSKDLQLTWSAEGTPTGNVIFQLEDPTGSIGAECTFAASAGQGSIGASTLAKFTTSDGVLSLHTESKTVQQVGDYKITSQLLTTFAPSGGSVTFQ